MQSSFPRLSFHFDEFRLHFIYTGCRKPSSINKQRTPPIITRHVEKNESAVLKRPRRKKRKLCSSRLSRVMQSQAQHGYLSFHFAGIELWTSWRVNFFIAGEKNGGFRSQRSRCCLRLRVRFYRLSVQARRKKARSYLGFACDRDSIFLSTFSSSLWLMLKTKLTKSTAFHP